MYAIVNIQGQQFKVEKNKKVYVHRLGQNVGDTVQFDEVLLIDNGGNVSVGNPVISGASVSAKVLAHLKGDKVVVFKKKRRKGYQVQNGHRQSFSQIEISDILASGSTSAKVAKAAAPKKEATADAETKKTKAATKGDDLKIIEGIGPKIAELFVNAGISTFAQLAETSVEKCKEILDAAGSRYAVHNPTTWPKQAELAAQGKWDELKAWQEELNAGK